MSLKYEIAVVGAGVGGLAVAALLRAQGHGVTIFDQAEAPVSEGPGLVLPPVVLPLLERLGIDGPARTLGVPIEAVEGHDAYSGKVVIDVAYQPEPALALQRAALIGLLHAEAAARGVDFHFGKRILGAATTGRPYLRIEGGTQAGPFDYLVDAGGAHSPLSPLVAREKRFGAIWTTVPLPKGEGDLGGVIRQRYDDASRLAAVVPLGTAPGDGAPRAGIYWSLQKRHLQHWAAAGPEVFKADVSAYWPDLGDILGDVTEEELIYAPIRQGGLTWPARRRIARIGDAAHQGNPMLAPGAALALMDAHVLADCMASHELADVSTRFVAARWLHLRMYQGLSRLASPMFQSRFGAQAALRNRVFGPAARLMSGTVGRVLGGGALSGSVSGAPSTRPVSSKAARPVSDRAISEPGE